MKQTTRTKQTSTPWHSAGEILSHRPGREWNRAGEPESAKSLRTLLQRSQRMQRLEHQVHAALPLDLRVHCGVAHLENGELRLIADGSVWATRLRFESPRLKETLRQLSDFRTIDQIKVRAGRINVPTIHAYPMGTPADPSQRPAPRPRKRLNQIGADCLRACAREIDDGELKSALSRLASSLDS